MPGDDTLKYSTPLAGSRQVVLEAIGANPQATEHGESQHSRTKPVFELNAADATELIPIATVCSATGGMTATWNVPVERGRNSVMYSIAIFYSSATGSGKSSNGSDHGHRCSLSILIMVGIHGG